MHIFGSHCHADAYVNGNGFIEKITVTSDKLDSSIDIPGEWAAQNPSPDRNTLIKEVSQSLNGASVEIIYV